MNPKHDPELDELLETPELRETANAVMQLESSQSPPLDFNQALRRRWQAEIAPRRAMRIPRWLVPAGIAAAVMIGVFSFSSIGPRGGGGGVAWAQVAAAMNKVQQFHMIAFIEDPRAADPKRKQFRIDLYFQQPDRWRGQGLEHVQFLTGQDVKTWSIEQSRFLADNEKRVDLAPGNFIGNFKQHGMLAAVLSHLFRGQVPAGEAVKSDQAAESAGIAVFDFAHEATNCWARIWVLRESQLPLRMHVHFPDSDEFGLVSFDYSDPQPDEFFDPTKFEQGVRALGTRTPHAVYNVGSSPVSGFKPRGASQIHQVQGGYRAPVIKRILANEAGDVRLITDNPQNRTPAGHYPTIDEYRHVIDNWGNRYLTAGGGTRGVGANSERTIDLIPVPPFKTQEGQRTLTLEYWVQEGVYVSRERSKPLGIHSAEVPPASDNGEWNALFQERKQGVISRHIRETSTLAEQLAEIDRLLKADPDSMDALAWKFQLLRSHGKEEAAWELFESRLRDRVAGEGILERYNDQTLLGQYLLRLMATGRMDEHRQISTKIRQAIESAAASTDARRKSQARSIQQADFHPLVISMEAPGWIESIKDAPRLVRSALSDDGLVVIELEIPATPMGWQATGSSGAAPMGWFWEVTDQGRWPRHRVIDLQNRRLLLAFENREGGVKPGGMVRIAADGYGSIGHRNDITHSWSLNIGQPTQRVGNALDFLTGQAGGRRVETFTSGALVPRNPSQPALDWMAEASRVRSDGKLYEAIALYERVLNAPDDQWPDSARSPQNDPPTVVVYRRQARGILVECLSEAGRFDDARAAAQPFREGLPTPINPVDYNQWLMASNWVTARLHVAKELIKRSRLDEARQELGVISDLRIPLIAIPDEHLSIQRGSILTSFSPRTQYRDLWRKFDSVWWEVKEKG